MTSHISLIIQLTSRQVIGRYKGSTLGLLWSFLNPLILLSIYTFAFSYVFQARWGLENENHLDFALILFASLTIFNLFAEVIREAPSLVIHQPNFVKKVIFPLDVLPIVSVLTSLVHAIVSLVIFFVFYWLVHHSLPWTIIYLPFVIAPILLLSLGTSYFLSSIGVYIRDIGHFMGHFVTILLFTSPVFYSTEKIPESFRKFLFLNPIAILLEESRGILVFEKPPQWGFLALYFAIGAILTLLGWIWFNRIRKGFADIL
jgi:lipopolysaccharide transport system permease protein